MQEQTFETTWAGKPLKVTFGKMAWHTNMSCIVQYGEAQVLATAVMSKSERPGINFFPLLVDYEEKMYAAGKIKGSRFIKRETKPTDEAVLTGRLIDRTIRPMFDPTIKRDVQVVITVLSTDGENDPDILALVGAALVLHTSDIPWSGPVTGLRVSQKDGQQMVNPTYAERENADFEMLICGNEEKTVMVECEANEAKEEDLLKAFELAQKELAPVVKFINDVQEKVGLEKQNLSNEQTDEEKERTEAVSTIKEQAVQFIKTNLDKFLFDSPKKTKIELKEAMETFKEAAKVALFTEELHEEAFSIVMDQFKDLIQDEISLAIREKELRVDGRGLNEVRPLIADAGLLLRTHGSALFSRGETQVLSVVTLGAPGDKQVIDGMEENGEKTYMHHYNFPGYSVGEVKPFRGASRRDVGHGALAEKALVPVLPKLEDFPYTVRVVSETMTSNGSSSMASVCGSTLALMDAGVPIKRPVAGVAIGLASDGKAGEPYKILTDIQDIEDGFGGMDFKVAGTREGVTAIQLDTKTDGLTFKMVEEALAKAKQGRYDILDVIEKCLEAPRESISQFAPQIEIMTIDPDKIRDVIGPGGKMINQIIDETGASIDIEQDGSIYVSSPDAEGLAKAKQWITNLTKEVEAGEVYEEATVTRIMDFGAFCELLPGKEGLLHISEIAYERTNSVSDVFKVGDKVKVKVIEIDKMGRINLSAKALLPKPEGYVEPPKRDRDPKKRPPRREGNGRPDSRGERKN